MFYGLLASGSVLLSEISRSSEEDITLKKTIERLSRNLMKFDKIEKVHSEYINEVSKSVDEETVFCIDHTDTAKRKSSVWDGSKILEVAALTPENKLLIFVVSRLFHL